MPVGASPPVKRVHNRLPAKPETSHWPGSVPAAGPLPNAAPETVPIAVGSPFEIGKQNVSWLGTQLRCGEKNQQDYKGFACLRFRVL